MSDVRSQETQRGLSCEWWNHSHEMGKTQAATGLNELQTQDALKELANCPWKHMGNNEKVPSYTGSARPSLV